MKKRFAIIYDPIPDGIELENFLEVVRSNYISKIAKKNMLVIIAENDVPKDIYDNLEAKMKYTPSFLVIEFDNFYGMLEDDAITWISDQFPNISWIEPRDQKK